MILKVYLAAAVLAAAIIRFALLWLDRRHK